jgi:hypothetical protein
MTQLIKDTGLGEGDVLWFSPVDQETRANFGIWKAGSEVRRAGSSPVCAVSTCVHVGRACVPAPTSVAPAHLQEAKAFVAQLWGSQKRKRGQ